MGQFLEQFVPAGIPPALFWLGVFIVVVLGIGLALWFGGERIRPPTTLSPLDHPQKPPRVAPGKAVLKYWPLYLKQAQAGGGLHGELAPPPGEFEGDAVLRDASAPRPSGPPGTSGVSPPPRPERPALADPLTPERLRTPAAPGDEAALPLPATAFPSPPLPPPVPTPPGARAQEAPPRWDEDAEQDVDEAAEATAPLDDEGEEAEEETADSWDHGRPWVILPSRFGLGPGESAEAAGAQEQETASAAPEDASTLASAPLPVRFESEPSPAAEPDTEDPSTAAAASQEESPREPTTLPSLLGEDPSSPTLPEAAPSSPTLAGDVPMPRRPSGAAPEPPDLAESGLASANHAAGLGGVLGSPASPAPALLAIQAFGEAHLRVLGELVPMRKATKDLELILFLAHQAAAAQAQDKKIPYTYRSTLADALWPVHSDEGEGLALQSLKQAKFTLSKRLLARTPALVEAAWLESGQGRAALRLAPTVTTDLVEFLRLTRRLAHATHQASGSAPQAAEVEAWLSCLEQCYQGGFALQFREEEWVQGARARYRQQYLDARFDVARLYARLGRHGQAILLAKELLLEENVSADTILPPLLTWLEQEGGKGAVAHWQDEYRRRYQYKFQRSLAEDRPDQEALFRRFLNPAGR